MHFSLLLSSFPCTLNVHSSIWLLVDCGLQILNISFERIIKLTEYKVLGCIMHDFKHFWEKTGTLSPSCVPQTPSWMFLLTATALSCPYIIHQKWDAHDLSSIGNVSEGRPILQVELLSSPIFGASFLWDLARSAQSFSSNSASNETKQNLDIVL